MLWIYYKLHYDYLAAVKEAVPVTFWDVIDSHNNGLRKALVRFAVGALLESFQGGKISEERAKLEFYSPTPHRGIVHKRSRYLHISTLPPCDHVRVQMRHDLPGRWVIAEALVASDDHDAWKVWTLWTIVRVYQLSLSGYGYNKLLTIVMHERSSRSIWKNMRSKWSLDQEDFKWTPSRRCRSEIWNTDILIYSTYMIIYLLGYFYGNIPYTNTPSYFKYSYRSIPVLEAL